MTGTPLRRRLFVLTAACILPLAVMAGISLVALKRQQTAQSNRVGVELARSVANAVDSELRRSISILETLAISPRIDQGDFSGFLDRIQHVAELRPEWAAISLVRSNGVPVLDTRVPWGGTPPAIVEHESFDRVVQTAKPLVGSLKRHASGEWLFAVRAPVVRDGKVLYVLTVLVKPEAIRDVLTRQQVPEDWLISIVDADGLRVARSKAHLENLGGRLSPTVQEIVSRNAPEGFGMATSLEGDRVFTPYSRIGSTGWTAVLGIPTTLVDAAVFRSIAVYGAGILLSIVLGTFGGLWVARTITRPIAELRAAAEAVGRRQTPLAPKTTIQEINDVGAALQNAAAELSRAELEREALLLKERQAREAAEAADRSKDEFMAVVSHELRTPLNAVYGWARMLQSGQLDDQAIARATDAIVRNSDVQVQLIDDLLDLSRITTGKMRLHVGRIELEPVLHGALDAVRPAADAKGITLRLALDRDAGSLSADPARLQQIVWNLLMNAVKFTPRGGAVQLEGRRVDADVQIVVRDSGEGIAPEILPHLFQRFRQADSSSTRMHGGLGLGLALVKHLAELHGGTVVAASEGPGKGAAFTVTLPAGVGAVAPGSTPSIHPFADLYAPSSPGVRLDGLRVLVVDDDREGLTLVQAILSSAGAEVRACPSAPAALDMVREWRPDVLVSDIEMPGEDGYSLIRKVRTLGATDGAMPAIALTGYGRPLDRQRAMNAGFNMHVPKPVDPEELTRIIADVVGQSEQPRTT